MADSCYGTLMVYSLSKGQRHPHPTDQMQSLQQCRQLPSLVDARSHLKTTAVRERVQRREEEEQEDEKKVETPILSQRGGGREREDPDSELNFTLHTDASTMRSTLQLKSDLSGDRASSEALM
ncbi:unnamed protein product [Pleuronectes platessa]|uniref:Uncharacterized protein n=1 Tax=Pleuronectes platessa TaxID=8262 RepID=A0A9N7YWR8_PLEPL|nr:unnamed protein product [Pleuronectes platessa]